MNRSKIITTLLLMSAAGAVHAELVARFPMEVSNGQIREEISGRTFAVEGNFTPENVKGASGQALRFDGYTSRVNAALGNILPADAKKLTVSLWVAMPCYPIIQLDTDTSEKTPIVSCLDKESKTGFGFFIGFNGKYSFNAYIGGWPVSIEADAPLPVYQWNRLTAVVDCDARTAKLYNNDTEVGSGRVSGGLSFKAGDFFMGQGRESCKMGPFELMSYNGLIDDVSIWNDVKTPEEISAWRTEEKPDLDIPASRFATDLLRPRFHGMPAAGWTNETHGLVYSDGRWHLFFQKNGDGPYMARLHWGHISSTNLYDWQEEKIAIAPGQSYDMKGCWSGCVFTDEVITGNLPGILYTSVDYAKASISQASPLSARLDDWTKKASNPVIGARPEGLSDDFRDPYFFRNGNDAYIIVGSSKDGVGTTTLHKYNPLSATWGSTGKMFFTGTSAGLDGRFWEMSNITCMPGGKWLFTSTPLGTSQGVRTLYWTGSIATDGTFRPDASSARPRLLEMNSREGFGLLSPTVYVRDGRTIALGIVPDKLPDVTNWKLGWAHCYSLPREWSLTDEGILLQKPASELTGLRTSTSYAKADFRLAGSMELGAVKGRAVELMATFLTGNAPFGFNIFKSGASEAKVYYNPASGEVVADFSGLARLSNDGGVYDGIYRCPLPVRPKSGDPLKINIFIDHSILDIFIDDKWATSIRVFPTEENADGIEAYAEDSVNVTDLKAWILDPKAGDSGVDAVSVGGNLTKEAIYDMRGIRMDASSGKSELENLPAGIYAVGDRKIMKK